MDYIGKLGYTVIVSGVLSGGLCLVFYSDQIHKDKLYKQMGEFHQDYKTKKEKLFSFWLYSVGLFRLLWPNMNMT